MQFVGGLAGKVKGMNGFIKMDNLKDRQESIVLTFWETKEDMDTFIFATPIAIMSGINRAAIMGIIIKSGASIEQVRKAQVVVFDKTGTITYGTPIVEEIILYRAR